MTSQQEIEVALRAARVAQTILQLVAAGTLTIAQMIVSDAADELMDLKKVMDSWKEPQ